MKLRHLLAVFGLAIAFPVVAAAQGAPPPDQPDMTLDAATRKAVVDTLAERVERLWENTRYFKRELARLGYDTLGSQTPITPVLFGEAPLAFEASRLLLEEGVFAVGIGFPTVPRGKARIRNIVTAAHTKEMLDKALEAYEKVGKRLSIIR